MAAPQVLRFRREAGLELHRLKRAMATQSTVTRTEPLWDPRDTAVPRGPTGRPAAPGPNRRRPGPPGPSWRRRARWRMHWGDWVMPRPLGPADQDLDEELRARVREGLPRRYPQVTPNYRARLEQELDLIRRKRFAGYFLAVHDLVREARATRTCGRGSGAASIVSYLLGITNVDPIAANLMFERFLSDARTDPPDLDIDFAWDERDEVIASVFRRYGRERVAMVANHVLLPDPGRPARRGPGPRPARGGAQDPGPLRPGLGRGPAGHPGPPRLGRHPGPGPGAGGALPPALGASRAAPSSPRAPCGTTCPSEPAPAKEGVSITAWDKDGIEDYGLVKIDLLGNRSLAVVRDALEELGERAPEPLHWQPRLDPATQDLLARGDSMGVFYVESPAMRQLQQRVGKGDFETLVIHSSLIRPAANRWIDTYVKRSRGEEAYVPAHPVLGALLSESFGVLVYQEDVVRVGMAMAGGATRRRTSCASCWAGTTAPASCPSSRPGSGTAAPPRGSRRRRWTRCGTWCAPSGATPSASPTRPATPR